MSTDISPLVAEGRLMVESYGPGRFRISGKTHRGSLLLSPETIIPWNIADSADLGHDSLDPLSSLPQVPDVVLLGCGARMTLVHATVRAAWKQRGLAVDIMDTGAACRTFNVLVAEDRLVAAALIAL